jgi:hypothetical protein
VGIFAVQTSAGGVDVFLAKLDGAGNVVWIRQFGSSGRDVPNDLAGVAVDDSGVYAALRAGS